jgi:hypothetical protein
MRNRKAEIKCEGGRKRLMTEGQRDSLKKEVRETNDGKAKRKGGRERRETERPER